jgi:hypothetical protein
MTLAPVVDVGKLEIDKEAVLVKDLALATARYLMRNPKAADDVEGIMRWWLPQEQPGKTVDRVRAAVALLEQQGAMVRMELPDGHAIFSRAPHWVPDDAVAGD